MKNSYKGKKVLIIQQRDWAKRIGHPLACRLNQYGADVGCVVIKSSTMKFISNQMDFKYSFIKYADPIKDIGPGHLSISGISLDDVCKGLGVDTVWTLVQSSRNHVKNYKEKFYYSYRQGMTDEWLEAFIKATYKHVCEVVDHFNPDIIFMPNFAALQQIMFSLIARQRGIKLCGVVDSKVPGVFLFTESHLAQNTKFLSVAESLKKGNSQSGNYKKALDFVDAQKKKLAPPNNIDIASIVTKNTGYLDLLRGGVNVAINSCFFFVDLYLNKVINYKNKVSIDYRPPNILLRDEVSAWLNRYSAERRRYTALSEVKSYAYFPLQVQPEATIDVHATRFNNQLETARQVAMSMPGDMTLVVKDHPNMSMRRSRSYLDKIQRLPNVKLVDFRISTIDVVRNAQLVISPSSTTMFEAAYLGVPAIQLGELGTARAYPNIWYQPVLHELPSTIKQVLSEWKMLDSEKYLHDLTCCVAAAYDTGFEANYSKVWSGDTSSDLELILTAFLREGLIK
ncbi:hypothetical protein TH19_03415 [Thalassospira profundimaris]|uniref:Capsule polysaccharide biosynthesis protein n=2 Tax=Thalassospira TaxID=168934 RepID=A0A367WEG1_9PROT|nr:hypothetical protein TH19_03415 [Thalassospira profundimaris]